jgi:hypothetical protein
MMISMRDVDLPQVLKINIQLPNTCNQALVPPLGGWWIGIGVEDGAVGVASASFGIVSRVGMSNFSISLQECGEWLLVS